MTVDETAAGAPAGAECILVADGEVLVRMMIAQYLRDCGYKVIEASTTDEAITVLDHPELSVDIVLSDVEIPGVVDGFGLAQWVRQHKPGLHVLLVGTPMRAADVAAELCENGPMLNKPYEPQVVVDRIRRLLAERASRK
jgi:DNA-binding response OmpR family regulator